MLRLVGDDGLFGAGSLRLEWRGGGGGGGGIEILFDAVACGGG